ncbi:uncharacterized protein LOC116259151 [Nymphaea colorata]|nr:uncharacterized protein LOC116259151 [Nymphaea colorata]
MHAVENVVTTLFFGNGNERSLRFQICVCVLRRLRKFSKSTAKARFPPISLSPMEGDAGILNAFELHYSDLVLLSSSSSSPSTSVASQERLDSISRTVVETLGPGGHGLLAVIGVPNAGENSRKLLSFARKLALVEDDKRRRILKDHGLGTDVPLKSPDRNVSAFAMQLKYSSLKLNSEGLNKEAAKFRTDHPVAVQTSDSVEDEFDMLGDAFKQLGFCMMQLGLLLAKVCDKAFGGNELECSILESCAAKGRLIHYHSSWDRLILKEKIRRYGGGNGDTAVRTALKGESTRVIESGATSCETPVPSLWQQWHYDYGIFTVLTTPIFSLQNEKLVKERNEVKLDGHTSECYLLDGHTCLQILDPVSRKILFVRAPPESFIIQVGEAAEILSNGKLCSTIHSVSRPVERTNSSRETFVVFLQPAWNKTLSVSGLPVATCTREIDSDHGIDKVDDEVNSLAYEIQIMVPPLSARLKEGMTFADFSRVTTKQYYGGNGLQSNVKS